MRRSDATSVATQVHRLVGHLETSATRVRVGDFIAHLAVVDLGPGSGKSINESGTIAGSAVRTLDTPEQPRRHAST